MIKKGIPGCAATPKKRAPEEAPQACEATVTGNESERRDCRSIHGKKKEWMVAGELSKHGFHTFRQKDVQTEDTPGQAERDKQKGSE